VLKVVGKPNLPAYAAEEERSGTPGLTALDQEREASLADEGGRSGAVMESEDVLRQGPPGHARAAAAPSRWLAYAVATAALLGLAVLLYRPRAGEGYRALPPS
jgi:hypothetical protein